MTRYRRLAFVAVSSLVLVCMGMTACGSSASVYVKGHPQPTVSSTKTAIALAPPSTHLVSQRMDFNDPGQTTATGSIQQVCPDSEVAIGGGFRFFQTAPDPNINVEIASSYPVSEQAWIITFTYNGPVSATVYVECLVNPNTNVFIRENSLTSPNSVVTTCPAGSIVLGGGFSFVNGFPISSYPPNTTEWETDYDGNETGIGYAICYGTTLPVHSIRDHNITTGDSGTSGWKFAGTWFSCPAGTTMTSGGYERTVFETDAQKRSYAYVNAPDPQNTEWIMGLANAPNPVESSGLTMIVECVQF